MKKSNKLLLTGFLTVVLLITAVHLGLYAKYKQGSYTVYTSDDLISQQSRSFNNVKHAVISNLRNGVIIITDSTNQCPSNGVVKYEQRGDTLLIAGLGPGRADNDFPIVLKLSANTSLTLLNSGVSLEADKLFVPANSRIYAGGSYLSISREDNAPLQFGNVTVFASDTSSVFIRGNTQINRLEVKLSRSTLEDSEGSIGDLAITTDSLSRVSLQSKHMFKAKLNQSFN